ncbi:MAG: leucine-rich repeat domain-containing protein [Clostridiales bacterium]|nr:leucine-rich repeat domain-containing protein [Clostridiales bacterium]
MSKRIIALITAVIMTSQMLSPVMTYGETAEETESAVLTDDQVTSGAAVIETVETDEETAVEEDIETAAESETANDSAFTEEIISADFSESGSCGDNLTYTYDSDTYTLTISGTGDMYDYESYPDYAPWYTLKSKITSVIIEDGVTSIGNYAFYYCYFLTSVTIPDSVTSIGESAFRDCTCLASVTIPESVTSIGESAFYDCISLASITIFGSIKSMGKSVFEGCLFETAGPVGGGYDFELGSTESIPKYAFYNCTSLTNIVIPDSTVEIGFWAFYGCTGLTSVTIPDSVTKIDSTAFYKCSNLKYVYCYEGSTADDDSIYSFSGSSNVTIVYIDDISSITTETTTETTTEVTESGSCGNKLTYTYYSGTHTLVISGKGTMTDYSYSDYAPWYDLRGKIKSVIIEDGAKSIGSYAFYKCTGLTSITISDSVESIGESAFSYCTSLTSITIPDRVISIDTGTFMGCTGLVSITIPDSVTSINSYAFRGCSNLKYVYYYKGSAADDVSIYSYSYSSDVTLVYLEGAESTTSGSCGDDLTYTYDSDTYILTISGTGAMYDYTYDMVYFER